MGGSNKNQTLEKKVDDIYAEVSFQYTDSFKEKLYSFTNNIYTPEGGTHVAGFRNALTRILNKYARENKIPYLGICLGMQVAVIEFARNVLGLAQAHSTEFNPKTPEPVIGLITEWKNQDGSVETRDEKTDLGGSMRLGGQTCKLVPGTVARKSYEGSEQIIERHRHRFEFNNNYLDKLQNAGLVISGVSLDNELVEMVEIADHPWFVACQFHPEFTSQPREGHPLFNSFITAALKHQQENNS